MDISNISIGLSGLSLLTVISVVWKASNYASRLKSLEEITNSLESKQNEISEIALSIARIETRLDGIDKRLDRLEKIKDTQNA